MGSSVRSSIFLPQFAKSQTFTKVEHRPPTVSQPIKMNINNNATTPKAHGESTTLPVAANGGFKIFSPLLPRLLPSS
jgi:hypothetical protein